MRRSRRLPDDRNGVDLRRSYRGSATTAIGAKQSNLIASGNGRIRWKPDVPTMLFFGLGQSRQPRRINTHADPVRPRKKVDQRQLKIYFVKCEAVHSLRRGAGLMCTSCSQNYARNGALNRAADKTPRWRKHALEGWNRHGYSAGTAFKDTTRGGRTSRWTRDALPDGRS
jgi:hypothetical protein